MEDTFNPSLIISFGPSGRKAMNFSKKLLSHLPVHFLNLIDYYEVESLESTVKELQEILDTKLLFAKHLNKLVDLGFKVRSENTSTVKLDLYILWDVYSFEQSAYEAVKALSELYFGNIDSNQHSGVSLYIIPMMEREWVIDESKSMEALEDLGNIISYISKEESMLAMDSKVYVLHSISNDGARIPMEELTNACGTIAYLNIIPSKEQPLAHFNRRLLRNEAVYKVGTIGITSLMIFKDKLLEDFSRYLTIDILRHAANYEIDESYISYDIFSLIAFEYQKNVVNQGVSITRDKEGYRFEDSEGSDIKLGKDEAQYPAVFKAWEEYIEKQCSTNIKMIIDRNAAENQEALIKNIEIDLRHIILNCSLKEAVSYINALEREITKQRTPNKPDIHIDTSIFNEVLQARVNKHPKLLVYLYNKVAIKSLHSFMDNYKEQILKKAGNLINTYTEKAVEEGYKHILSYLGERKQTLFKCISNTKELSLSIDPVSVDEEAVGSLITDLFNFQDRHDFYKEKCPCILEVYRSFLIGVESFEELAKKTLLTRLKEYAIKASQVHASLDFFQYISFKYKESLNEALCKWIEKGKIKSKYLLQYTTSEFLEEHLLFITSPKIHRAIKGISSGSLPLLETTVIEGEDIHINSMSVIRLCLGVNIDSITSMKNLGEKGSTESA